ncbi:MAG: glycosyltransferase family 9 protein [Planctomycetes bacterium]|nr:glycosyltransferase family 9 protein [Planctomycetota bacterium]
MSDLDGLHVDCRHWRWDRPCAPHKARGRTCPGCPEYEPYRARVLVVKLAATGDVLRTTALLPAIHAQWPGARVVWLTAPGAVALFRGNPLVDEVLNAAQPLATARLAVEEFDAVLCPDADVEAAAFAGMARAREHRGFRLDAAGHVVPLAPAALEWLRMGVDDRRKKANRRTYQALVAEALGLDAAKVGEPILEPAADDHAAAREFRQGLGFPGRLVGLNTGAGGRWAYKQWTLEHQRSFLRLAAGAGLGVLLLGGPEERERHLALRAAARGLPVFDAGTDNSFGLFAAKTQLCAAVVTGDTFALHVATARRVPVVALFGPTSSAEIELYGRGEKIVPEGLECLVCYLPICERQPHCQALILPERVLGAVLRHLPEQESIGHP